MVSQKLQYQNTFINIIILVSQRSQDPNWIVYFTLWLLLLNCYFDAYLFNLTGSSRNVPSCEERGETDVFAGDTTAFLIGLFLKVDTQTVSTGSRSVKMNHFLVPTLMLIILGTFLEALIDQYVGLLDRKVRLAKEPNLYSVFT